MKRLIGVFILVVLTGCASSQGQKRGSEPSSESVEQPKSANDAPAQVVKVACQHEKDQRKIINRLPASGGCTVTYFKNGSSSNVAQANNDLTYCRKIVQRIQNNLESAGFDCHQ